MTVHQAANSSEFDGTPTTGEPRGRQDARGYIYLLLNDAFKDGWVKIGKTRRSGRARADEMNAAARTGLPKLHRCVLEVETLDCDRAETAVFARLAPYRQGQQEFFVVEISLAEQVIREECSKVTHEITRQVDEANARRARELKEQREAARRPTPKPTPPQPASRPSIPTARAVPPKPPSPPSDPRISGQWVTPEQAAAAWAARRAAHANRARRDAAVGLRVAEAPAPKNPHPEFKWILLLIAIVSLIAISL